MVWRRLTGRGEGRAQPGGKGNGMALTVESVRDTLRSVRDPQMGRDLISLRMFGGGRD